MNFAVPEWANDARALPNDAVVHLAQMAEEADWPLTLLFLNEAPALRQQLNANGLLRLPWWNVFDEIQGIPIDEGLPLDVSDVPLPADSDLIYDGSNVLILQSNKIIGVIKRHGGGVWQINWLMDELGRRVDQYNDRGLLTTRTWYTADSQISRKEWLGISGQWVMRQTDHVEIGASARGRFDKSDYPNVASVIGEFLHHYLLKQTAPANLVMTANTDTASLTPMIPATIETHFFVVAEQHQVFTDLVERATSFITETSTEAKQVQTRLDAVSSSNKPIVRAIPPFSTHLNLGRSNEVASSIIFWHVNQLNVEKREIVFQQLLAQLRQEKDNQLIVDADTEEQNVGFQHIAVRLAAKQQNIDLDSAEFTHLQLILNGEETLAAPVEVKTEMTEADEQAAVAGNQSLQNDDNETILAIQQFLGRITFQTKAGYERVSQDFATARLLVDLGEKPNLYMQIAAISAGIPQINRRETGYVLAGQNGQIITRLSELPEALAYYLDSLRHWNEALVVNARLIDQYSEEHSRDLWQEVLAHG